MIPPSSSGPVPENTRHLAMDAARGLALLGIFFVNILFFSNSFLDFFAMTPRTGATATEGGVFYFTLIFCQSKSYPLFSLLFGMGLALQMQRADAAGRRFFTLYTRRLVALALFGLLHILVLWYGDILVFYAVAGGVLLLLSRLSAKWLLVIAVSIIGIGTIFGTGMGLLGLLSRHDASPVAPPPAASAPASLAPAESPPPESPPSTPTSNAEPATTPVAPTAPPPAQDRRTPIERLCNPATMQGTFAKGGPASDAAQSSSNPASREWREAEAEAFRDGPFIQALLVRLVIWGMMFVFSIFSFLWHILAMFCIGAALVKLDIFSPRRASWVRNMAIGGLTLGLPLAVLESIAPAAFGQRYGALLTSASMFSVSTLVAIGYFGAIAWICSAGRLRAVTGVLAAAGRMALSNYLLESLITTFVMYHWGLRKFGTFDRVELAAFVIAVYCGLLVFSIIWLRFFRFGPMEWLWRSITYLKLQPMLKDPAAHPSSAA